MTFRPPADPRRIQKVPRGRVLVIAPHPDDETLGPGGTLALHVAQGDPITVLFVASGIGGDPDGWIGREHLPAVREAEAREAARRLGLSSLVFLGYPDNLGEGDWRHVFGNLPEDRDEQRRALVHGISTLVETWISEYKPDIVYYPWEGELNPDHWMIGQGVRNLLQARPDSTAGISWLGYEIWAACTPDLVVDISCTMSNKLEATRAYKSQLMYRDYTPHIMGLGRYRALFLEPGATFGEAFTGQYKGQPT